MGKRNLALIQLCPGTSIGEMEALFGELKNQSGLRCLRLRRLKFVGQFFLAATAQNIKRWVRFLSQRATPQILGT